MAPSDGQVTPVAGRPISPPGSDSSGTAPVGQPIGPAVALPSPTLPPGKTDVIMERGPEIARERGLPTIDVEVLFDFNSAEVTPTAAENLLTLGRALADPQLAGSKFVIAGHTDAKGHAAFNQGLSQRRSEAVRAFLIEHFKVAPENLIARGYGETRLKNPRDPKAAENRRVQVINWTSEVAGAGVGPARRR